MANESQPSVSLIFSPFFDVLCDLLLNRRRAIWNLFVLYHKELKYTGKKAFILQISTLWQTWKYHFDVIYCLYKIKAADWLQCLAKYCDWFTESRNCQIWIERCHHTLCRLRKPTWNSIYSCIGHVCRSVLLLEKYTHSRMSKSANISWLLSF